eukprot:gene4873-8467_t
MKRLLCKKLGEGNQNFHGKKLVIPNSLNRNYNGGVEKEIEDLILGKYDTSINLNQLIQSNFDDNRSKSFNSLLKKNEIHTLKDWKSFSRRKKKKLPLNLKQFLDQLNELNEAKFRSKTYTMDRKYFIHWILRHLLKKKFQNSKLDQIPFILKPLKDSCFQLNSMPYWFISSKFNCKNEVFSETEDLDLSFLKGQVLVYPLKQQLPDGILLTDDVLFTFDIRDSEKNFDAQNNNHFKLCGIKGYVKMIIDFSSHDNPDDSYFNKAENTIYIHLNQKNLKYLIPEREIYAFRTLTPMEDICEYCNSSGHSKEICDDWKNDLANRFLDETD